MGIRKFEITDDLFEYTDSNLTNEDFADNVNCLFPIKDSDDIIAAFEVMKNIPYNGYSDAEKLYMLDRICKASVINEISLEDLIEEVSPGGTTMIDKNSPEFKEAVASEVKIQVDTVMADLADKDKRVAAKNEFDRKVGELTGASEKIQKDLDIVKAEKEKIEQEFKEYKTAIETKAKIQERVLALKNAGLELEDWKDTEEAVAEMSDKAFTIYKNELSKALHYKQEMKKKDEEEEEEDPKKDKKKKVVKASIVDKSNENGNLPNGEPSNSEVEFPFMTAFLEADYGMKKAR